MPNLHFAQFVGTMQTWAKAFPTMIDTVYAALQQNIDPVDFASLAKTLGIMSSSEGTEDVSPQFAHVLSTCAALMAILGAVNSAGDTAWTHAALVYDLDEAFTRLQQRLHDQVFLCDDAEIESFKPEFRGWSFL